MYGATLAHSFSLQPQSRTRTIQVFCTIGITAVLSWPFVAVLASVFLLQDILQVLRTGSKIFELGRDLAKAGVMVLLALVPGAPYVSQP
jgi:hypothetical protein